MNPDGSRDPDLIPETCHMFGHVHGCQGAAGGEHELTPERRAVIARLAAIADVPEEWFEDDDDYLREPLTNEGQPEWNGAFRG